jgi:hypothetical protein
MAKIPQELSDLLYQKRLPKSQYFQTRYAKKQFVLHHTGSGDGVNGDYGTWASDSQRVATAFIIERNGKICQVFSSAHWAFALGIGMKSNKINPKFKRFYELREQQAVQVEIDSWGFLKEKNGKYYSWTGTEVPKENVIVYPEDYPTRHAGLAFEKYTDKQIKSVRILSVYLHQTYGIPLGYNEDMWDVSEKALSGEPGIWTHSSYVSANLRNDCHPQPELIEMLKSIA